MSLWVRFFAVSEEGRKRDLGDRWSSKHKAHTHADPEDESYEIEIDLEKLPPNTKKIVVEFIP